MSEYLGIYEVVQLTGISIDTIYRGSKDMPFPKRIKVDGKHPRWDKAEVIDWMCRRNAKKSPYYRHMSVD